MELTSYVSFEQFAKMLGKTWQGVAEWYKAGYFSATVQEVKGHPVRMISKEYADKVKMAWDLSCPPIKAARMIGIPERGGSLKGLIEKEIVKTINPLGKDLGPTRVLLSSIPVAREYMAGSKERLRKLRQTKAAEMLEKRWAKRRRRGTRRLMTLEEAAKALGKNVEGEFGVRALVENFTLRTFSIDNEVFVYISQVEVLKKRMEAKRGQGKYKRGEFKYKQFTPPRRTRLVVSEKDPAELDPDEPQELGVGGGDEHSDDE